MGYLNTNNDKVIAKFKELFLGGLKTMNPLWLILIVPASATLGFITCALLSVNAKED